MYHPQPYDPHAYWGYGAYAPATNMIDYPYPIYGHPMVGSVELTQYPKPQMIATSAAETVNANTGPGMVAMVNTAAHDSSRAPGVAEDFRSNSPSTAQRQNVTKTRIRVTDPDTKEDLTEKLAEMYAQLNEERKKKEREAQANSAATPAAATPMPQQPEPVDASAHVVQGFDQQLHHGAPMVFQQAPVPQYERRSGGNRGSYSSRRGGGGVHYRPNQTAQVKPRVAPQRGHRPFNRDSEEVRVNRVQPQVHDSKQWSATHEGSGASEVSPRSGKVSSGGGHHGNTGKKDRNASLASTNESVDGDAKTKSSEALASSEEKKLPEVTCIVDENHEIIQVVSDSAAVIVDVSLKDLVKKDTSDSEKPFQKESLDDDPKPVSKSCDEPSPVEVELSTIDKIDTVSNIKADDAKPKEPAAKELPPIFPSSNVTGLPERRDGGAILSKHSTWGNKYSQKHAAIVKPMQSEPVVSQKDLKSIPVPVAEATKPPEQTLSSSSVLEKPLQKAISETVLETEQTSHALPQRPAPAPARVASSWSARLGASLAATANNAAPQSTTVPVCAPAPYAAVSCNNDTANRGPTPASVDATSNLGDPAQTSTKNKNSEQFEKVSGHVTVSAKSSVGSSSETLPDKQQRQSGNGKEKDQNNDTNSNEASNVVVDQDGFQEVKQKRKPKQYSGVLAAGAAPQPNSSVMRASSRFNTSSTHQSTVNSGALSHVPSNDSSSRSRPVNSLATTTAPSFSRQMPPNNRSSSSEVAAAANTGSGPGTPSTSFRGRGFGRPPLRGGGRGGWGRGALRSSSNLNSATENVRSNEDLTEVTIMKSLQFESSNTSNRNSEVASASTSWADDVEAQPVQSTGANGSGGSWSQIVRKGGFSASKRDSGFSTFSKSSTARERSVRESVPVEDSRPAWARIDSCTSLESNAVKDNHHHHHHSYQEKDSYDSVSRRERSISPKLRQSSRQSSFSVNDTAVSANNAESCNNKANTDFSITTSSASSSSLAAVAATGPVAAAAATVAAAPIPRAHSPKRRQMSPPTFSSLRTESDKRIGANRARPTVTAYANRSPSPPTVELQSSTGAAPHKNDVTNDFQRLTSSSSSNRPSVFASVQNNPPKPRQTAVVNPMKFE